MKYLSLFSGIEAATVAWEPLGWECVGVSEIEPFPCALLAHHYPNVPNLGDITKVTEWQIADLGQIDLVVFGSPCQDLSVAGKRKGLAGERSGLFHTAMQIIEWARQHCGLRWALWENVPGAFSSNAGADFAAVVENMAGVAVEVPRSGWGTEGVALGQEGLVEWAVLDAQWFGVAQRRRRVFALADFGDWQDRPPILLEPHRLRGDTAPSREAGESTAGTLASRTGAGGFPGTDEACSGYVQPVDVAIGNVQDGSVCTISSREHKGLSCGRDGMTSGAVITYGIPGNWIGRAPENGGNAVEPMIDVSPCQTTTDRHGVAYAVHGTQDPDLRIDQAHTLGRNSGQENAVLAFAQNTRDEVRLVGGDGQISGALAAQPGMKQTTYAMIGMAVRRLTPTECERLQGFPDGYTQVPHRGKTSADGNRYKALGNSMAVPVMRWIGEQIELSALV